MIKKILKAILGKILILQKTVYRKASFLKSKGYSVYADTYINTIFVREDKWKDH